MSMNRIFRVFISSTFEDFQIERELLRSRVWPELENFCKMRNATFEAIDLRWGIPANSAEDLDIVSICLDEVERCQKLSPRPNFIALIGNRYGWRPLPANIPEDVFELLPEAGKTIVEDYYLLDKNAIPDTYLIHNNKLTGPDHENQIIEKIRESITDNIRHSKLEDYFFKSATHLEIDEGIFKPKIEDQEDHFFACFRDIKELRQQVPPSRIDHFSKKFIDVREKNGWKHDEAAGKGLEELGNDIREKLKDHPSQIGNYHTTLEELSSNEIVPYMESMCFDIENWLKKMIETELSELDMVEPLQFEIFEHKRFKDLRNETFGGREVLLNTIKFQYEKRNQRNIICIHGIGGSGKSALLSRLINDTEKNFQKSSIIYRFVGATPGSVDLNRLLEGIVDELNMKYEKEDLAKRTSREEHVNTFHQTLNLSSNNRDKTFLFIDALDQLNNTENAHSLYWLPQQINENTIFICSVLNGPIFESFRKIYPDATFFDISPKSQQLGNNEIVDMLKALLSKKPARKLQQTQIDSILQIFNKNRLMLGLKLIAENARHWHSYDTIQKIE